MKRGRRHFYLKKYIFWRGRNIVRWIELVLCIVCLSLAITIYTTYSLHIVTMILLFVVANTFLFVTFVDAVSWIPLTPMGYRTWAMIATAAFLMFWLCGGFLAFLDTKFHRTLKIYTCVVNFVTGFVYLLDLMCILWKLIAWTSSVDICPGKETTEKSVSTCFLFPLNEEQPVVRAHNRLLASPRKSIFPGDDAYPSSTSPRCNSSRKCSMSRKLAPSSYGGTFPVSKDHTPLPSPEQRRSQNSEKCGSVYSASPHWQRPSEETPVTEDSPRKVIYSRAFNPRPTDETPTQPLGVKYSFRLGSNSLPPEAIGVTYDHFSKDSLRSRSPETEDYMESKCTQMRYRRIAENPQPQKPYEATDGTATMTKYQSSCGQARSNMILSNSGQAGNTICPCTSENNSVCHQYFQNPCSVCGKTHYRQQTTVTGTLTLTPIICTPVNTRVLDLNDPSQHEPPQRLKRNGLDQAAQAGVAGDPSKCPDKKFNEAGIVTNKTLNADQSTNTLAQEPVIQKIKAQDVVLLKKVNTGIMATQQMKSKEMQSPIQETKSQAIQSAQKSGKDYNPQTSETRMLSASHLQSILPGVPAQCNQEPVVEKREYYNTSEEPVVPFYFNPCETSKTYSSRSSPCHEEPYCSLCHSDLSRDTIRKDDFKHLSSAPVGSGEKQERQCIDVGVNTEKKKKCSFFKKKK